MMVLKWFNKLKQSKTKIIIRNYMYNDHLVVAPPNFKTTFIHWPGTELTKLTSQALYSFWNIKNPTLNVTGFP